MDHKILLQLKRLKTLLFAIGALIVLLLVFKAGEVVGFRKANFSYRWGENYYHNFTGARAGMSGMPLDIGGEDFVEGHGTLGSIVSLASSTLVVKGNDASDVEKVIVFAPDIQILRLRQTITVGDLRIGDRVVIIGSPNNAGEIEAKFVRVIPGPSSLAPAWVFGA